MHSISSYKYKFCINICNVKYIIIRYLNLQDESEQNNAHGNRFISFYLCSCIILFNANFNCL